MQESDTMELAVTWQTESVYRFSVHYKKNNILQEAHNEYDQKKKKRVKGGET